ncbi:MULTISPECIES: hypothetical protein [unclassified Streptomyces]|nr:MULTISPECIES: hypothetical protein [unclassified Streptomyces]MBD3010309.1 hypothetical protein [Streptomyces sp. 5-10]
MRRSAAARQPGGGGQRQSGDQSPVYGWWAGEGPVEGAFLCTPPYRS